MDPSNDNTVTALDYIQKQEELEKEAKEALPGKFEKCTFPLGYIRQPLYACKTCQMDSSSPSGMCYSCSMSCHADHELIELFPKRHFRCDCGLIDKFNNHPCALMIPAKKIVKTNNENKYSHNFRGNYCRCDQAYDPEKEEGTMFQCITCEDWFHERCIGNIPESVEDFDCYICRDCTKKHPFVLNGEDKRFSFGLSKRDEIVKIWVLQDKVIKEKEAKDNISKYKAIEDKTTEDKETKDKPENEEISRSKEQNNNDTTTSKETLTVENINVEGDQSDLENAKLGEKRKREDDKVAYSVQLKKFRDDCSCVDLNSLPEHDNIEVFLQETWREGLCKCKKCLEAYKTNKIEFLLNEEPTHEPEEDEDAGKSLLEMGMEQLQRIDRVQVLESLMAYTDLANDLKNYFATFKDTGKIVTKEDIDEFFSTKKREKE